MPMPVQFASGVDPCFYLSHLIKPYKKEVDSNKSASFFASLCYHHTGYQDEHTLLLTYAINSGILWLVNDICQ